VELLLGSYAECPPISASVR